MAGEAALLESSANTTLVSDNATSHTSAVEESMPPNLAGWEASALFLCFMGITVTWELMVGTLTFLNNIIRGRKATWLHRVKEELLGLGIISLVLLFLDVSGCLLRPGHHAAGMQYVEQLPAPTPAHLHTYTYIHVHPRAQAHKSTHRHSCP